MWLLLALLVLTAVVGIPLVVRSSRSAAWRRELADAEGEVGWFARDLVPTLQAARSAGELRGAWAVGQGRVTAVEQRLAELTVSARRDADRLRAGELHDAVERARDRISRVASGDSTDLQSEVSLLAADLDSALRRPPLS